MLTGGRACGGMSSDLSQIPSPLGHLSCLFPRAATLRERVGRCNNPAEWEHLVTTHQLMTVSNHFPSLPTSSSTKTPSLQSDDSAWLCSAGARPLHLGTLSSLTSWSSQPPLAHPRVLVSCLPKSGSNVGLWRQS